MNNKCTYFKKKQKNYKVYFYCVKKGRATDLKQCFGCNEINYKESRYKAKKTPINKVSKKRITVSKKTYDIVYNETKGRCGYCGNYDNLEYHHILYRSERKDLIDDPGNGIMICHKDFSKNRCHRVVHNNKKKYQPILLNKKASLY